jgi:hypothetical protein
LGGPLLESIHEHIGCFLGHDPTDEEDSELLMGKVPPAVGRAITERLLVHAHVDDVELGPLALVAVTLHLT